MNKTLKASHQNRKSTSQTHKNSNEKSEHKQNTIDLPQNNKQKTKKMAITSLKAMPNNSKNGHKEINSTYKLKNKHSDYVRSQNKYNPKDYLPHQSFQKLTNKQIKYILDKVKGCRQYHYSCLQCQRTKTSKKGCYSSTYETHQNQKNSQIIEDFRIKQTKINFLSEKPSPKPFNSLLLNEQYPLKNQAPKITPTKKITTYNPPKVVYDSLKDNRVCGIVCCEEGQCYGSQEQIMAIINKFK